MSELADLLRRDKPPVTAVRAIVSKTVSDRDDDLFVTVSAFDGSRQTWGPCPWVPSNTLPAKGDEVLLILTADGEYPWVMTTRPVRVTYDATWIYDTLNALAAGDLALDGLTWPTVEHVLANRLNADGTDVSHYLRRARAGGRLLLSRQDDADQFGRYTIDDAPLLVGGDFSIPVTLINSAGGIPANNRGIAATLITQGASDD